MEHEPQSLTGQVSDLKMQVIEGMKKRGERLSGLHNRIVDFSEQLKVKYPHYNQRRAYHALIGSTMPHNVTDVDDNDFPGDDSVIGFFNSLLK